MLKAADEPAYNIKLPVPHYEGTILYDLPQGSSFMLIDSRGWQYEMRYDKDVEINQCDMFQYSVYLLHKRMTRREMLLEKLAYCLHEHWGLAADPSYNYRSAVMRLSHGMVVSLLIKAELAHSLMLRHQHQELLIINTYNKLVECLGWATNTSFCVCERSGMLNAQLMN